MYLDPSFSAFATSDGPRSTVKKVTTTPATTATMSATSPRPRRRHARRRSGAGASGTSGSSAGICSGSIDPLLNHDEHASALDRHPGGDAYVGHPPCLRRAQLVLHFHCFDHDHRLPSGDEVS